LVLGTAALLGLSTAGEPPMTTIRPFRDAESLYVSVELEGLPGEDLERLVDASFNVRVSAAISAGTGKAEVYREISFDGLRYEVTVSETGGVREDTAMSGVLPALSNRDKLQGFPDPA
jgi:hypothetical protein